MDFPSWMKVSLTLLLVLQVCNILSIIGCLQLEDYWQDYTKTEITLYCGKKKNLQWANRYGNSSSIDNIAIETMICNITSLVLTTITFVLIKWFDDEYGWVHKFIKFIAEICCLSHFIVAIYYCFYWNFLVRIDEYCDSNSEFVQDNDIIEEYFLPVTILYWIAAFVLCVITTFAWRRDLQYGHKTCDLFCSKGLNW